MTIELFREDARLWSCEAVLLRTDETGLVFDQTVFYPLGGGQAGDRGRLLLTDGSTVEVVDTRKDRNTGDIVHLTAPGDARRIAQLQPGQRLRIEVDGARRERHMRFHTATHLLCALVPHPVDGCSITAEYARLDFHMTGPLDKGELEAGLARLIAEAHPVSHRWISETELDANPGLVRSMSVQPPRGLGRIRVLEIAGVDLQPCGGTHVSNTAEIGAIQVTKIEKKSASTRRVVLGWAPTGAAST